MTAHPHIRVVSGDRLDLLIRVFAEDCKLRLLSEATVSGYIGTLWRYHWWCDAAGRPVDVGLHDRAHVRAFLAYLQQPGPRWGDDVRHMSSRPMGPRSQESYFRTLAVFYNWLVREEYIDVSPMARLRSPRVVVEQPEPFSTDELDRIVRALLAAGDDSLAIRNRAIVATLLDVGPRVSEMARINVSDISPTTGDLHIARGKGGKGRHLAMGAMSRKANRRYWLRVRHQYGEAGPFYLNINGEQLTVSGVERMIRHLGIAANVENCHPHRFRHTAAVNAIRAGMNPFEVQAMLGHTDLTMTRRYVKLAEGDIREAARSHSPLDHLRLKL